MRRFDLGAAHPCTRHSTGMRSRTPTSVAVFCLHGQRASGASPARCTAGCFLRMGRLSIHQLSCVLAAHRKDWPSRPPCVHPRAALALEWESATAGVEETHPIMAPKTMTAGARSGMLSTVSCLNFFPKLANRVGTCCSSNGDVCCSTCPTARTRTRERSSLAPSTTIFSLSQHVSGREGAGLCERPPAPPRSRRRRARAARMYPRCARARMPPAMDLAAQPAHVRPSAPFRLVPTRTLRRELPCCRCRTATARPVQWGTAPIYASSSGRAPDRRATRCALPPRRRIAARHAGGGGWEEGRGTPGNHHAAHALVRRGLAAGGPAARHRARAGASHAGHHPGQGLSGSAHVVSFSDRALKGP